VNSLEEHLPTILTSGQCVQFAPSLGAIPAGISCWVVPLREIRNDDQLPVGNRDIEMMDVIAQIVSIREKRHLGLTDKWKFKQR